MQQHWREAEEERVKKAVVSSQVVIIMMMMGMVRRPGGTQVDSLAPSRALSR